MITTGHPSRLVIAMAKGKPSNGQTTLAGRVTIGAVAGAMVVAAAPRYAPGMADLPAWLGAAVGGAAAYLRSRWKYPIGVGKCWAPAWRWLPSSIRGCGNTGRATDGDGNAYLKGPCWLHPNGPYIHPVSRLMGRDGEPKQKR